MAQLSWIAPPKHQFNGTRNVYACVYGSDEKFGNPHTESARCVHSQLIIHKRTPLARLTGQAWRSSMVVVIQKKKTIRTEDSNLACACRGRDARLPPSPLFPRGMQKGKKIKTVLCRCRTKPDQLAPPILARKKPRSSCRGEKRRTRSNVWEQRTNCTNKKRRSITGSTRD